MLVPSVKNKAVQRLAGKQRQEKTGTKAGLVG
jgi:hypothetical protein